MKKHLAILVGLLGTSCTSKDQPSTTNPSGQVQVVERNCLRIVKSEMGNILTEDSPIFQKALDSCKNGTGYYNDEYAACIQQSPYSNALDCAYKARGIDRSENNPALRDAKVGQYGGYSASVKEMQSAVYKDADPRQSIDSITLNSYLERRDRSRDIAGLKKIEDNHIPISTTHESLEKDGTTYWVVRQTYQELQLTKIMREIPRGAEEVLCVQYGPIGEKLELDSGLCAGLLKQHFKITSLGV